MEVKGVSENLTNMVQQSITTQRLRIREQEVKAHELAHKSVGGELAGPIKYKYSKGPDGRLYITGGEVPLQLKEGRNPEETLEIARKVKRAALAPANPSAQDRAIAAKAAVKEMKALMELMNGKGEDKEAGGIIDLRL